MNTTTLLAHWAEFLDIADSVEAEPTLWDFGRFLMEEVSEETSDVLVAILGVPEPDLAEVKLRVVKKFLPTNYHAVLSGDIIIISGKDSAGWTMDGYVLPRLASGGMYAKRV